MSKLRILSSILLAFLAASFSYAQDKLDAMQTISSPPLGPIVLDQIIPSMADIPAGSYELYCRTGEVCVQAEIDAFQIMEHELTWNIYQPCIDAGVCPDNSIYDGDEGWGKGDRPVINVSFRDVTEYFIPWLNKMTGGLYRLPTDAEWEFAAGAGSNFFYHWGDEPGEKRANCAGCGSQWDGIQTAPVMSFPPNNFGLYDMHGNVWELTSNCTTGIDRASAARCDRRVIRGGSYIEYPSFIGIEARSAKGTERKQSILGFRLARDL